MIEEKIHEECGVFGVYSPTNYGVARDVYYGLYALQHRGQESCGIVVNVTPIETEFEGQVVLEFSNTTTLPAKIYAGEGACQFLFFKGNTVCETSYKDRNGKYQNQTGITLPKV